VHAKTVFILPNNGNIDFRRQPKLLKLTNEAGVVNVHVIPSKTIPQGLVAAITTDVTDIIP